MLAGAGVELADRPTQADRGLGVEPGVGLTPEAAREVLMHAIEAAYERPLPVHPAAVVVLEKTARTLAAGLDRRCWSDAGQAVADYRRTVTQNNEIADVAAKLARRAVTFWIGTATRTDRSTEPGGP